MINCLAGMFSIQADTKSMPNAASGRKAPVNFNRQRRDPSLQGFIIKLGSYLFI